MHSAHSRYSPAWKSARFGKKLANILCISLKSTTYFFNQRTSIVLFSVHEVSVISGCIKKQNTANTLQRAWLWVCEPSLYNGSTVAGPEGEAPCSGTSTSRGPWTLSASTTTRESGPTTEVSVNISWSAYIHLLCLSKCLHQTDFVTVWVCRVWISFLQ